MAPEQPMTKQLVDILDARYGQKWDLYRLALGGWGVKLPGESEVMTAEAIEAALGKAVEFTPLPRIPRVPTLLFENSFEVVKSGSHWDIHYNGGYYCGSIKTKTKAKAVIAHHVQMAEKAYLDWRAEFGHYRLSDEGVTFRWAV